MLLEMAPVQNGVFEFSSTMPIAGVFSGMFVSGSEQFFVRSDFLPTRQDELSYWLLDVPYASEPDWLDGVPFAISGLLHPYFELDTVQTKAHLVGGTDPEVVIHATLHSKSLPLLLGVGPVAYLQVRVGLSRCRSLMQPRRIVDVDIRNFELLSPSMASPLVLAAYAIIKAATRPTLEREIQRAVDKLVYEELTNSGLPKGTVLTAHWLAERDGRLNGQFAALVPMEGVQCPSSLASGATPFRPTREVDALRELVPMFLSDTKQGNAYLQLFNQHRQEMIKLLLAKPQSREALDIVVSLVTDTFVRERGRGVVGERLVHSTLALIEQLAEAASDELIRDLRRFAKQVPLFEGREPVEVLRSMEE